MPLPSRPQPTILPAPQGPDQPNFMEMLFRAEQLKESRADRVLRQQQLEFSIKRGEREDFNNALIHLSAVDPEFLLSPEIELLAKEQGGEFTKALSWARRQLHAERASTFKETSQLQRAILTDPSLSVDQKRAGIRKLGVLMQHDSAIRGIARARRQGGAGGGYLSGDAGNFLIDAIGQNLYTSWGGPDDPNAKGYWDIFKMFWQYGSKQDDKGNAVGLTAKEAMELALSPMMKGEADFLSPMLADRLRSMAEEFGNVRYMPVSERGGKGGFDPRDLNHISNIIARHERQWQAWIDVYKKMETELQDQFDVELERRAPTMFGSILGRFSAASIAAGMNLTDEQNEALLDAMLGNPPGNGTRVERFTQNGQEMFRVIPADGEPFVQGKAGVIAAMRQAQQSVARRYRPEELQNITQNMEFATETVRTLQQLMTQMLGGEIVPSGNSLDDDVDAMFDGLDVTDPSLFLNMAP